MKGYRIVTILVIYILSYTQLSDAAPSSSDDPPSFPPKPNREEDSDGQFKCLTRTYTNDYIDENKYTHHKPTIPSQSINDISYEKLIPSKQNNTLKSIVNTVSNITYITAILYFWLNLIKMIKVIYNDFNVFSYYLWISFKLLLHIIAIIVYLYILFYFNEESENNGIYLMFIIGSIEYVLD